MTDITADDLDDDDFDDYEGDFVGWFTDKVMFPALIVMISAVMVMIICGSLWVSCKAVAGILAMIG